MDLSCITSLSEVSIVEMAMESGGDIRTDDGMTYSPGVFYSATLPTLNASLLIIRGDISSLGTLCTTDRAIQKSHFGYDTGRRKFDANGATQSSRNSNGCVRFREVHHSRSHVCQGSVAESVLDATSGLADVTGIKCEMGSYSVFSAP